MDGDKESPKDKDGNWRGVIDPLGKFWPGLFAIGVPFGSKKEIENYTFRILQENPVRLIKGAQYAATN